VGISSGGWFEHGIARHLTAVAAMALLAPVPALAETVALTCRNSSASWDLKIDTTLHTVNGAPAAISADEVTWHVRWPSGGIMYYKFDRTTGSLLHRLDPADASWNTDSQCARATRVF
jgi:hypothetical protein